ncbi:MAG: signal peptidase I [Pseudobdellovibrio sp.]
MKTAVNIYWIVGALIAALFFRGFIISVYKIPTLSMAPTLLDGDFILASQMAYRLQFPWSNSIYLKAEPQINDLIVFQFSVQKAASKSSAQYLKRIVAVAGDQVEIKQGHLILNGNPCEYEKKITINSLDVFRETCAGQTREVAFASDRQMASYLPQKVPANEVYVLGDNRTMSDDSRDLGSVGVDQIAGRIGLILFSYGSTQDFISGSNQSRWNRILTKPR